MKKYFITTLTSTSRKQFEKEFDSQKQFFQWCNDLMKTNVKKLEYYTIFINENNMQQRSKIETITN